MMRLTSFYLLMHTGVFMHLNMIRYVFDRFIISCFQLKAMDS